MILCQRLYANVEFETEERLSQVAKERRCYEAQTKLRGYIKSVYKYCSHKFIKLHLWCRSNYLYIVKGS